MARRLGQWMTGALVVWVIFLAIAWSTSDGAPACEGLLITQIIQKGETLTCRTPVEGLIEVGPVLLGLLVVFGLLGFLATTGLARRRKRSGLACEDDS